MKTVSLRLWVMLLALTLLFTACGDGGSTPLQADGSTTASASISSTTGTVAESQAPSTSHTTKAPTTTATKPTGGVSLSDVPAYNGEDAYAVLSGNQPAFSAAQLVTTSYESYADLDSLGRCGVTIACVGKDIMPTEERGNIGQVKPSGWVTAKYDIVDGKYLYNRCHLIGFQLTGENANVKNLITGTRYMNVEGMLPFENMVADYVKETGNHVLYRVTPIFAGNNLVASGVQMEAFSVEDNGEGICFNVYVYNVQPGIGINYATGESWLLSTPSTTVTTTTTTVITTTTTVVERITYVLNTNTKKFHLPSCGSAKNIKESNKDYSDKSREELIADGYDPCKNCNP